MKKNITAVFVFAAFAAGATLTLAGSGPQTGVNGSFHDITYLGSAFNYNQDEFQRVCVFCHTPHNAQLSNGLNPLWNHAQSTQMPAPYAWAAPLNLPITIDADPLIGPSRLCQGCHDGVTAVDAHGSAGRGNNGTTPMTAGGANADPINLNFQKRYIDDLTITHPIGFLYDDAVAARPGELVPKTNGFILENAMPFGSNAAVAVWDTNNRTIALSAKRIQDTLYGGYVTCASCHEVHNAKNVKPNPASGAIYNYFLWAQEEGSAICLSCHIK